MRNILVAMAALCLQLAGQNSTGSVSGTVTDPNGAVIPGAAVTVSSKATGGQRKMTTGADGNYAFENLLPGDYEVRAGHDGFSSQTQTVTVVVGATTTAAFSLQVGAASQVIEVTGMATTVNTTDIALGGIVDREQAENLPLNGRSFLSMAMLEPGVQVSYESESGPSNPNNFFQVSINGAPQQLTSISFDGARVNDRVTGGTSQNFSVESVQEFQVSTFNFDLSSGTVAAGAINVVSRTGTNQMHGASFFYFRDHNMAAYPALRRDPFYPNPYFARKQFGANLGGALKKDRLFYYGNYERTNQVGARTVVFTDPLLTRMNHVARQPFKGHLGAIRLDYRIRTNHTLFVRGALDRNNSVTGTGIESGWVASSNFSYQSAMGLTSVLRNTMVNDLRFSFSYFRNWLVAPTQDECTAVAGNPDYCVGAGGPRVSFFGGMTIGNSPNGPQDRHPRTYQLTDNFNWSHGKHRVRFGGNWEHDFDHGSWSRNTTGSFGTYNPTQLAAQNPAIYNALPASLKIGSTVGPPTLAELLTLPVAGAVTIGVGDPGQPPKYHQDQTNHNDHVRFYIQDQWALRRGLTFNYGIAWSFENNVIYHDTARSPFLYPLIGEQKGTVPYDYNNFDPAIGLAWAPGRSHRMVFRGGLSIHHSSSNVQFLKLNDSILNYPAGVGLTQASSVGIPNPRAGETGMPANVNFTTPGPMTAGALIALMPQISGAVLQSLRYNGNDPSIRNVEVAKTIQGPGSNDIFFDKNYHTPYTIHATAGFSKEILPRTVLSVDYVMTRGVKFGALEGMIVDLNRWNHYDGYSINASGTAALGPRRPVIPACVGTQSTDPKALCSLGPVQYGYPGILSRYQALNVKVNRAFTKGVQFTGGFAIARNKSFVNVSNFENLWDGFGNASGVRKYRFTGSAIYQLPLYKGTQRALRQVFNGWQLSTLMDMSTGPPISVSLGSFDLEGDGTTTFRLPGTAVNTFGRGQSVADIRRLVDEYNAKYPAPTNALLATIPRANRDALGSAYPYVVLPANFANADSFLTHDLRLTRQVRVTEKVRMQIIAEGFNVFNIANMTGFSGTLDRVTRPTVAGGTPTNPTFNFGQATGRVNPIFGTGGPRAFQVAARLNF